MNLNRSQLRVFQLVAKHGELSNSSISSQLALSPSLVSRYLTRLVQLGFLERSWPNVRLSPNPFAHTLTSLLLADSTLADVLADRGITVLATIMEYEGEEVDIRKLSQEMSISPPQLYIYLRRFLSRGILSKHRGRLTFNRTLWNALYEFLQAYQRYYVLTVFAPPPGAKLYRQGANGVLFSSFSRVAGASLTGFSMFPDYGIQLLENERFYRLPKQKVTPPQALLDALRIAGSPGEESARRRLYCYLFYRERIKHVRSVRHPDLETLKKIANGSLPRQAHFPTAEEIQEKAKEYDIRL